VKKCTEQLWERQFIAYFFCLKKLSKRKKGNHMTKCDCFYISYKQFSAAPYFFMQLFRLLSLFLVLLIANPLITITIRNKLLGNCTEKNKAKQKATFKKKYKNKLL
jgi:hypothetical protein